MERSGDEDVTPRWSTKMMINWFTKIKKKAVAEVSRTNLESLTNILGNAFRSFCPEKNFNARGKNSFRACVHGTQYSEQTNCVDWTCCAGLNERKQLCPAVIHSIVISWSLLAVYHSAQALTFYNVRRRQWR